MDNEINKEQEVNNEELKKVFTDRFEQIGKQNMLIGFQVACSSILEKIATFEKTPGNKSNNDHKRLIKDIKKFCETSLSLKNNSDEEVESSTIQN